MRDITAEMGNGMADYSRKAALSISGVVSVAEYDLCRWYVAGVVGEGLTRLFVDAVLGGTVLIGQGL